MRKWLFAALVLSISFSAGNSFAAHPLVTDDADTVGKGGVLLELNTEYGFDKEGGVRARGGEVAALVTYGLLDNIDLVLGVPYQTFRVKAEGETFSDDGLADVTVELKWRFFEADRGSYALKPAITLPTGDEDKGFGTGKVTYGLTFIASRQFEPVDLHLNLGYVRNEFKLAADKEELRSDIWQASLAAVRGLTDNLDLVGNIGIERAEERDSNKHPAFALAGLIYSVTDNLDIDFGVKFGLNSAETDLTLLAGLAWSF
jgi:hypothetical protein